jgi:hypothetical protein
MFIYSIGVGLYVNKITDSRHQKIIAERNSKVENTEWKTIGVKIRVGE